MEQQEPGQASPTEWEVTTDTPVSSFEIAQNQEISGIDIAIRLSFPSMPPAAAERARPPNLTRTQPEELLRPGEGRVTPAMQTRIRPDASWRR